MPKPQEISQGAVKAALSYTEAKGDDGEITRTPIVTTFFNGKEVAKLEGEDTLYADPPVSLQIAELDPSIRLPRWWCRSSPAARIAARRRAWWRACPMGRRGGPSMSGSSTAAPCSPPTSTATGAMSSRRVDNAFLYAFACYACSTAPLELLTIENGVVKNVTGEERFRPVHAAYIKELISEVPDDDVNGYLAGYVGEKSLLGESKGAWKIMLNYYDKASDWGLETCDKPVNEDGECPGQTIKLTYPDALERMLKENGYKIEVSSWPC